MELCFLTEENRKQVFIRVEVAESCGGWQEAILLCSSLMMQCSKGSAESELLCNHSSGSGEECSLQWKHAVPELQGGRYWLIGECSSRTMLHKKWQEEINDLLLLALGFQLKGIGKTISLHRGLSSHCILFTRLTNACK